MNGLLFRANANLLVRRRAPGWPLKFSSAPSFVPENIAGLVLKLDPQITSSLFALSNGTGAISADGDRVGYIGDLSGSSNPMTQATVDVRGYYRTTGLAGFPSVETGVGPAEWNYYASPSILGAGYNTAVTIFSISAGLDDDAWRVIIDANNQRLTVGEFSDAMQFDTSQLSQLALRHGVQALAGNIRVAGFSYDGAARRTIINGHLVRQAVTGNLGLTGAFALGNTVTAGDRNWRGDFGSVWVWNAAFTDNQMRQMCQYLMRSYNLTQPVLKAVVYAGDSLTQGTGAGPNMTYPQQVSGLIGYTAQSHHNTGIGGAGIAYLDSVAPALVDTILDASLDRAVLVAWMGSNDIAPAGGDASAAHAALSTYCANRRAAGFDYIIACTMLPRSNVLDGAGTETRRQAFNTLIRNNYTSYADALCDLAADARIGDAGDETNTTYYDSDRVHMNATGYGVVAGLVAPYVTAGVA